MSHNTIISNRCGHPMPIIHDTYLLVNDRTGLGNDSLRHAKQASVRHVLLGLSAVWAASVGLQACNNYSSPTSAPGPSAAGKVPDASISLSHKEVQHPAC